MLTVLIIVSFTDLNFLPSLQDCLGLLHYIFIHHTNAIVVDLDRGIRKIYVNLRRKGYCNCIRLGGWEEPPLPDDKAPEPQGSSPAHSREIDQVPGG